MNRSDYEGLLAEAAYYDRLQQQHDAQGAAQPAHQPQSAVPEWYDEGDEEDDAQGDEHDQKDGHTTWIT